MINLLSDTVTKPDRPMLEAMMAAEVGDDVFGEDPTVNALEERMAGTFGMEAALFCPSGTMSNQIAIKVHTRPLDELICDHYSHVFLYEMGGYAFNSGIAVNPLAGRFGKLTAGQIEQAIKPAEDWLPRTKLVVLENSTNKGGGNFYTNAEIEPISVLCHRKGLALHLDGARIFNVLVETGDSPAAVGALFDSISVCLSKGLGAPVGSVLMGNRDYIREARRIRKVLGGGMRQAGYLAAAGIYALDNNIPQLKIDNQRAAEIGRFLSQQAYVQEVLPVRTNIVIFELAENLSADTFLQTLDSIGIKASPFSATSIRFVFHRDITQEQYDAIIPSLSRITA
ncbi:MAG TPA: GntG family PLP-dependent aldolase [Saprospiraceae bacterium]|nr:MAG: threonine aldolase [Candidatus Parvibacillus calidus]HRN33622.1 GntG family PLP-dependent aldolase [Saprospiraceae bacterium]HRP83650.1 GntG family PLP-dependent aldolase [Saprospiraceae bacterium]